MQLTVINAMIYHNVTELVGWWWLYLYQKTLWFPGHSQSNFQNPRGLFSSYTITMSFTEIDFLLPFDPLTCQWASRSSARYTLTFIFTRSYLRVSLNASLYKSTYHVWFENQSSSSNTSMLFDKLRTLCPMGK